MTRKAPNRTYPFIPYRKTTEIDYDSLDFDPHESVKKPSGMGQQEEQIDAFNLLYAYFAGYGTRADVFCDYNSNICWDPDDLARHVSPDLYIALGVDAKAIRNRLIYLPWEAGKPPDLVMEIATADTASEDVDIKPGVYETVAAPEYWMFDATGGRFYGFPLKGLKLVNGKYQEIELTTEPDGVLKGVSDVLDASVAWDDGVPRLYDHASGEYFESLQEISRDTPVAKARREAAEARRVAMEARLDAATKELEAVRAESRASVAERFAAEARLDAESKAKEAAEARADAEAKERAAELAAFQVKLKSEAKARDAAETKIHDLRKLIGRMENP